MKNYTVLFTAVLIHLCSLTFCQDKSTENINITNSFFKAYEEMDFEKMASYWDDSVTFQDVIAGEVYGINDTYMGRQANLDLWKQAFSKRPNYIHINIREQYASGNFVINDVHFENSTTNEGKTAIIRGEMFTIFEFKDGKIIKHFDFGDYTSWARQTSSVYKDQHTFKTNEATNISIAKKYFEAYADSDINRMKEFYASDVEFKDLTAKDIFNSPGFEISGKEGVTNFWKGVLVDSNAKYSNVKVNGVFYSASYVMLNTTFSMILPESWVGGKKDVLVSFPIKTILQIKDGKVHKHWDFADYVTYQSQIALQTTN